MKISTDLIESVRTTVTLPSSQALMTDDRLLGLANEEVDSKIVPMITSLNQEYFVTLEEEATVANQAAYDIPYRAIGRTLRDLKLEDSSGSVKKAVKIALEDSHLNQFDALPLGFYFQGDQIILVPTPTDTDLTIQKYYLRRPNTITKASLGARITAVSGDILTLANVPTLFVATATVDIIQGKQGSRLRAMDQTITNVSSSQITVSSVPTGTVVGDYVGLSGESVVIQLPDEVYPYLVLLTSKRVLEAIGDYEAAGALEKEIMVRKKNCEYLLAPRIEGAPTKLIQRSGLLRGTRGRYVRGVF